MNKIIHGDNLDVLLGMKDKSIDLIYLDPPFNKKKTFVGSTGLSFKDLFGTGDINEEWIKSLSQTNVWLYSMITCQQNLGNEYNFAYLAYIAVRVMEMHRVLKDTGSLYLHCDHTMSHHLKIMLDSIFGEENFRNEIIWCYRKFGRGDKNFKSNHDTIFYYAKNSSKVRFNKQFEPFSPKTVGNRYKREFIDGRWQENKSIPMDMFRKNEGVPLSNTWEISFIHSQSKERTGYPTQKPLPLLERIIKASSNEGDIVLDPFCGSGTTCVAAKGVSRKWIGIDKSPDAVHICNNRLNK